MANVLHLTIIQERTIRGTSRSVHVCYEGPAYQSFGFHPQYVSEISESAFPYGQDEIEIRISSCVSVALAGYPVEASAIKTIQRPSGLQCELPRLASMCQCRTDC